MPCMCWLQFRSQRQMTSQALLGAVLKNLRLLGKNLKAFLFMTLEDPKEHFIQVVPNTAEHQARTTS